MCFKDKENLQPVRIGSRGTDQHVCRGCWYEIDKIIGFLSECTIEMSWASDQKDIIKDNTLPETKTKKES